MMSNSSFERGRFYSSSRHFNEVQRPSLQLQRPLSTEDKNRRHSTLSSNTNKSGLKKLTKIFKKEKGDKTKTAPAYFEDFINDNNSSDSPNPFVRNGLRSHSAGSRVAMKVRRVKERGDVFFMWKPIKRKKCEWESMSGRQLTLRDVHISKLSKVELEALQQIAISNLQALDISVSKSSIRSGKLKIVKRKGSNERPVISNVVFGQPLTTVLDHDKSRGVTSPVHTTFPISIATTSTSTVTSTQHPEQPVASPGGSMETDLQHPSTPTYLKRQASILPLSSPQVPQLVRKTIDYLDNNGIKTEGLFRIPGAKARIDMIKQKFDSGEDVELTEDTSPHDVACVFKEFFRSLPEPLMTRELYYPFLKTRKLSTRALQKNALRFLVALLPRPNRDTLQELLQFLSRVALHSNGIILIDGTEETGNRMTEENLATILGPNILHNECRSKSPQQSYQVMKQDPEELTFVCQVMTDLIRMQDSLFTVPADVYDSSLQHLFMYDHEAVDGIMRQKCLELEATAGDTEYTDGPDLMDQMDQPRDVPRSKSFDYVKNLSVNPSISSVASSMGGDLSLLPGDDHLWANRRSHSFNQDEEALDNVMKDLEEMMRDGVTMSHRRHFSNDSAMGESECVTSPFQVTEVVVSAEPNHISSLYNSVDSAISNNSPHHSPQHSIDDGDQAWGVVPVDDNLHQDDEDDAEEQTRREWIDDVNDTFESYTTHNHTSSCISDAHSDSPTSPQHIHTRSSKGLIKAHFDHAGSLPVLDNASLSSFSNRSSSPFSLSKRKILKSCQSITSNDSSGSKKKRDRMKKNRYVSSLDDDMPSYNPRKSPILSSRSKLSSPTDESNTISAPATAEALKEITPRFHFILQPATEVLI